MSRNEVLDANAHKYEVTHTLSHIPLSLSLSLSLKIDVTEQRPRRVSWNTDIQTVGGYIHTDGLYGGANYYASYGRMIMNYSSIMSCLGRVLNREILVVCVCDI